MLKQALLFLLKFVSKNKLLFTAIILFIFLCPILILGENAHLRINDNLDSHIIWYKILKSEGKIFANSNVTINSIMSAPRLSLYNEFSVMLWLHYIFGTFRAMVINKFIIHFVALFGVYLLSYNYFRLKQNYALIISLIFALLPFRQFWGIGIAGQPLLLFIFLMIRKSNKLYFYQILVVIIYAFYSNFYSVGLFFSVFIFFIWVYDLLVNHLYNSKVLEALVILVLLSICIEYRLIYNMFFNSEFISHRLEINIDPDSFYSSAIKSISILFKGHYQARANQLIMIIPLLVYIFTTIRNRRINRNIYLILLFIVLISLIVGFKHNIFIKKSEDLIPFLGYYSYQRFYTLYPLLWFVLLILVLKNLAINNLLNKILLFLISINLVVNLLYDPVVQGILNLKNGNNIDDTSISFKNFFSEDLFNEIENEIHLKKATYKVASLGIHPAVSEYNGFQTIDGYLTNYPLQYKHEFKKVIKPELDKNKELYEYFNNWGHRCYIFDNELDRNFLNTKNKIQHINELDLNYEKFKELGGKFIFSTVKIIHEGNYLKLMNVFENDTWRIYVYKVI